MTTREGPGPVARYLVEDHRAMEALLARAESDPARFDHEAFEAFRGRLLRHIGLEEKILLVHARRKRNGEPHPLAARLRMEHAAITSLLVPTPDRALVGELRSILSGHDAVEEGPGGLYETCEELAGEDAAELVARMREAPPVRLAAHYDGPEAVRTAADALRSAGRMRAPRARPEEVKPE